jgi:HD superfamily phosphodiesterase
MKAKEAREKALSVQYQRVNSEYAKVKKEISTKVEDGKLSLTYDLTLCEEVISLLKSEGYEIRHFQSGMNEYSYEITW